jgi:hypothetical protein
MHESHGEYFDEVPTDVDGPIGLLIGGHDGL